MKDRRHGSFSADLTHCLVGEIEVVCCSDEAWRFVSDQPEPRFSRNDEAKKRSGMRLFCAAPALIVGFALLLGCGGSGNLSTSTPSSGGGNGSGSGQGLTTPFVFVSNTDSGTVSGFAINPTTGALTPVPGSPFSTPTPVGLARDDPGKYLTVANGKSGVSVIGVDPQTGALSDLHSIDNEAPGSLRCYPLITNTHGSPQFVAAQKETIYVGNVGSDDISVFLQNPPNGDLGTSIPSEFMSGTHHLNFLDFLGGRLYAAGDSGIAQMKARSGTITLVVNFVLDSSVGYRAVAIHNSRNFLYAIDENDSIHVFCLHMLCDLGEENQIPVASPNGASSIVILANFAYVTHSNSGDVSVYSIDPGSCTGNSCTISGALTFVKSFPAGTGATSARIFLNKFLYVANATDGTVSGYSIDSQTGLLSPVPGSPFQTGRNPTFIAVH
jgi:6-phosphogluconolactonase (cycloisomerase 2 family)